MAVISFHCEYFVSRNNGRRDVFLVHLHGSDLKSGPQLTLRSDVGRTDCHPMRASAFIFIRLSPNIETRDREPRLHCFSGFDRAIRLFVPDSSSNGPM
jgi:hypothetical protein